jgi:hypothetical protein
MVKGLNDKESKSKVKYVVTDQQQADNTINPMCIVQFQYLHKL